MYLVRFFGKVFCHAIGVRITYFTAYFETLLGRDLAKACLGGIRDRIQSRGGGGHSLIWPIRGRAAG